ncbi:MAG: hypothetical protein NTX92_09260 [Euryarchaeota archaeon]|nr:hypothetical protein [Euryarchaeota archaeon]
MLLYRGLNLAPYIRGDAPLKFDPNRLNPVHGFYGYGIYFTLSAQEATVWGDFITKYKAIKKLNLFKEPKTHNGINIKRKDYLVTLPKEYDGIIFGCGAEGGEQVLLRETVTVKFVEKVKLKR